MRVVPSDDATPAPGDNGNIGDSMYSNADDAVDSYEHALELARHITTAMLARGQATT